MAKFQKISQTKAEMDSATGKRAELLNEYLGYLNQLKDGEAGKLEVSEEGESPTALRRRIGKAATYAGKEIVIKRKDDAIYFWLSPAVKRQRRLRRSNASGS